MLDTRNALPSDTTLALGSEHQYTINEEIGRGASCICYDAFYTDAAGLPHRVRIKECFPYYLDILRKQQGILDVPGDCQAQFEAAKKKFYAAYQKNVELKLTLGLINSTADAIGIFPKNNTWYVVMGCVEGVDYRAKTDNSLQSVFIRMKALSKIIQKYHSQGVLHLDIKPENILVIPETMEHMILFDFDSLLTMEELQEEPKSQIDCAASYGSSFNCKGEAQRSIDYRMSFSDGFAAPELIQGRRDRICEATDIYAIGVIVFYKLFGRAPSPEDAAMGAKYDFRSMQDFPCQSDALTDSYAPFQDLEDEGSQKPSFIAYPPEFFQTLTQFFQKTLSSSVSYRCQSTEEAIAVLDALIQLSNTERLFLQSNFSYHSSCFVGRRAEMQEIADNLENSHVLFLSGIGGIGKTETAKRFAYEHQECFRNILFVSFQDTILKTVCGDGIQIHNVQKASTESEEEFFSRKLEILRQITMPEDLVILDNFDVGSDPCLEDLLECPCKFLITSREDFRDYNYVQTDISQMKDPKELFAIFRAYHPEEYEAEEEEKVKAILEFVEGHTMTIELIAKYLRDTKELPSALLEKLLELNGILGTGETKVKHRKDKKLQADSISRHLRVLFNLSCFSEGESELIKSLSLMGAVRIRKDTFLGYCNMEGNDVFLANLIRRGWILFDPDTEKISLHQIILDLVYHDFQPTSEQCPHLVASMVTYVEDECSDYLERNVKEEFLSRLLQRLQGEDLAYASLLVSYCDGVRNEISYLENAEQICKRICSRKCKGLLQKICILKIKYKTSQWIYDVYNVDAVDEGVGNLCAARAEEILLLAQKSYGYAKEFSQEAGYLIKLCVQLAETLDWSLGEGEWLMPPEDDHSIFDIMIRYMEFLWEEAEAYLLSAKVNKEEKIALYQKIRDFYQTDTFTTKTIYRQEHCGNQQKAFYYQEIINSLSKKEKEEMPEDLFQEGEEMLEDLIQEGEEMLEDLFREGEEMLEDLIQEGEEMLEDLFQEGMSCDIQKESPITFYDMAKVAEENGDYESAIAYYEKEKEEEGDFITDILYQDMSETYLKMGNTEKAIEMLEQAFSINKIQRMEAKAGIGEEDCEWGYDANVCCRIIELLFLKGEKEKARKYAEDMVCYYLEKKEGEMFDSSGCNRLIAGYYWLSRIEEMQEKKKAYWDLCVAYYKDIVLNEGGELSEEIMPFVWEYGSSIPDTKGKIEFAIQTFHRCFHTVEESWKYKYVQYIDHLGKESHEFDNLRIQVLVKYSHYLCGGLDFQPEKALEYSERAKKIYDKAKVEDEYLCSLVYGNLAECYGYLFYPDEKVKEAKKKCNCYLVAERIAPKMPVKEAILLWEEAAAFYHGMDLERMEACYQQAFAYFDPQAEWWSEMVFKKYAEDYQDRVGGFSWREGVLGESCQEGKVKYSDQEKRQKFLEISLEFYQGLLCHYYILDEGREWAINRERFDFCDEVRRIAFMLGLEEFVLEAMVFYVLAILAEADNEVRIHSICPEGTAECVQEEVYIRIERHIFQEVDEYLKGNLELLLQQLRRVLHGRASEGLVEKTEEVWEEMQPLLENTDKFLEIEEEVRWFLDTYQYGQIEFKR